MHMITANTGRLTLVIEENDDVTSLTRQVIDQIAAETYLSERDVLMVVEDAHDRLRTESDWGSYGDPTIDVEATLAVGVAHRIGQILTVLEEMPRYEREGRASLGRWIEILDEAHNSRVVEGARIKR